MSGDRTKAALVTDLFGGVVFSSLQVQAPAPGHVTGDEGAETSDYEGLWCKDSALDHERIHSLASLPVSFGEIERETISGFALMASSFQSSVVSSFPQLSYVTSLPIFGRTAAAELAVQMANPLPAEEQTTSAFKYGALSEDLQLETSMCKTPLHFLYSLQLTPLKWMRCK